MVVSTSSESEQRTVLSNANLSLDPIVARLAYLPTPDGLKLVWNMSLRTPDDAHWYDLLLMRRPARLCKGVDWVDHATYNVYPRPVESPQDGSRSLVTDPNDAVYSPFGWHDTNGVAGAEFTDTRGQTTFRRKEDANADNTGGFPSRWRRIAQLRFPG